MYYSGIDGLICKFSIDYKVNESKLFESSLKYVHIVDEDASLPVSHPVHVDEGYGI